jgi:hypothetical protein
MMNIGYTGQERIDAGTAVLYARSLRREPQRWHNEFIWLVRDDGLRLAVLMPYENRFITPRWIEKDAYGEERLVVLPAFSAYLLKREVQRWFKYAGINPAMKQITKAQLDSGLFNRIGIDFGEAA